MAYAANHDCHQCQHVAQAMPPILATTVASTCAHLRHEHGQQRDTVLPQEGPGVAPQAAHPVDHHDLDLHRAKALAHSSQGKHAQRSSQARCC